MPTLPYQCGPVVNIQHHRPGVRLLLKREDMNHPTVSGNKWWKLKYNLEEALAQGQDTLLTFGGAFSNHLFATAAAAHEFGLKSIGIVRGERAEKLSSTLDFAQSQGMMLEFVSREDYRRKQDPGFIQSLRQYYGNFYLLPEGGTNSLAVKGCEELGKSLLEEVEFDLVALPVGTGGTMAGLVNALPEKRVMGFSALKGGGFLQDEIAKYARRDKQHWEVVEDFHFGGYGKVNDELRSFMLGFEAEHGIPLDPVYTGKMMFGLLKMIEEGKFAPDATILALHTGGLQGRKGFNF